MADVDVPFWTGFGVAVLVGFLAALALKSWDVVQKTYKRVFINPPRPLPKGLAGATNQRISGLATDPDQSALTVLNVGCFVMFGYGLFSVLISGVICAIIGWAFFSGQTPSGAWSGVLFAAVVGGVERRIRYHWKQITILWGQITRPPVPTTRDSSPPNLMVMGARPAAPAFRVVTENSRDIGWHFLAILFFLSGLFFVMAWLFGGEISLSVG